MKKKLTLQEIRVKSFKTEFEQKNAETVKGGKRTLYYGCQNDTEYFKCSLVVCFTDVTCPVPISKYEA
ncbi:MAG: pinensin family lanthipeptide [Bacteroidota bacterium]